MSGPNAREAVGVGFDHLAEGVMGPGSLLLQMKADAGEQFVGQGFIKQGAVRVASFNRVVAKRKPTGMWRQCGVCASPQIGWAAGLAVCRRVVGQASTYRNVESAADVEARVVCGLLGST